MTPLHALSTLVVGLVAAGMMTRSRTAIHMRCMTAAFVIDLGLVLYIEITRQAVERVAGPAGPLIWFHAAVSTSVLLLYAAQLTLGRRMLAGRAATKGLHMALGLTFCVCRLTNYATAFLVSAALAGPAPAAPVSGATVARFALDH